MEFQYLVKLHDGRWELRVGEIGEEGADVLTLPEKFAVPLLEELKRLHEIEFRATDRDMLVKVMLNVPADEPGKLFNLADAIIAYLNES